MDIKPLLKRNKILPLLTIIGAAVAIVLSMINLLTLTLEANIIIALLGLIAVDALTERITILEKIQASVIKGSFEGNCLKPRSSIKTPPEFAAKAEEICILTLHGSSVIPPHINFYANKIKAGCKMKVILVSPEGSIQRFLNIIAVGLNLKIKESIELSLNALEDVTRLNDSYPGKCEVKLSDMYYPFSIVAVDINKPDGKIIVEFHSYQHPLNERPHLELTHKTDPYGYNYYRDQFNEIWNKLLLNNA